MTPHRTGAREACALQVQEVQGAGMVCTVVVDAGGRGGLEVVLVGGDVLREKRLGALA